MVTCWENKVWGRVQHIFSSPHAAVSYLEVEEGTCCSRHYHRWRANLFYCLDAELVIETWVVGDRRLSFLRPGDGYTVPSGILHRFRVLKSGKVIEVYWPDKESVTVSIHDIVRLDEGGPDNEIDQLREELGLKL